MKVNWRMGAVLLATTLAAMFAVPDPAAAEPRPPVPDAARQQARASATEANGPNIWSEDPDAAGKCVDVWNWGAGPWIQMWACHGGPNQQWDFLTYGDLTVDVFTNYNGTWYCIDGFAGHARQLIQYQCDGSRDQRFIMHGDKYGVFALESVRWPGQCMDVYDWGRGIPVQLWDCHWGTNQLWEWH
jgi:hypothetical protein